MSERVVVIAVSGAGPLRESTTDITEGVKTLYDTLISTLDNDVSGMLYIEDYSPLINLAKTCGFEGWEKLQEEMESLQHSKEASQFHCNNKPRVHRHLSVGTLQTPSTVCQLPNCYVIQGGPQDQEDQAAIDRWEGKIPHEHAFSSVGICMWPGCREIEQKEPEACVGS